MAVAKQNLGGVYANMDFPPYEYREYPKHIRTGPYGKYEVALNQEDELKILTRLKQDDDNAPAIAPAALIADPEKEILISRVRELGVAFNPQWSKAKLSKVVDEAEKEVDNLPPEEELDEKAKLYKEAKALGLKAQGMHLWKSERLKAAIAEAKEAKE